jgi:cation diffusion facilitator CzcD-associated flavoprotein CzcO
MYRAFSLTGPQTDARGMIESCRQHLESQVSDRALVERLWPSHRFGCKRPLFSDDFYPAMTRSNVELITDAIESIEPHGIRTADGRTHEADVIVYATGFETGSFIGRLKITAGDRELSSMWRGYPASYLGVMVAGFPNLFMLYGPNTGLTHSSILLMHEAQIDFFLACARSIEDRGAISVRPEVMDSWTQSTRERLKSMVWSGGCGSWYQNEGGEVITQWPGTVDEYVDALRLDPRKMLVV